MKKFLMFSLSLLFTFTCLFQIPVSAENPADFELNSNIAIISNLDTNTVVYEKNSTKITDPSTFTKIVTAIVAMENCKDLDKTVATASKEAINPLKQIISTNVGIEVGENLTIRQLLNCMLNYSANDASNVIAEEIGGSIDEFVKMMNDFVKKIGCENTKFVNAHGIYEEGQQTTAQDMLKIGEYAMNVPGLLELSSFTSTANLTIPKTNMHEERKLSQTNHILLRNTSYYYPYAKGLKAGGSSADERLVMSSAVKDGYTYLCIAMESPYKLEKEDSEVKTNYALKDTKFLFTWAFSNFKYKSIVNETVAVAEIDVKYCWDSDFVQLLPETGMSALVLSSLDSTGVLIEPDVDTLPESLEAPLKKGDVIGTASVIIAGEKVDTINIVIGKSLRRSNTLFILDQLKIIFTSTAFKIIVVVLILFITGYVILILSFNKKRKKLRLAKYSKPKSKKRSKSQKYQNISTRTRHDDPRIRSRYEDRENSNVLPNNSSRHHRPKK